MVAQRSPPRPSVNASTAATVGRGHGDLSHGRGWHGLGATAESSFIGVRPFGLDLTLLVELDQVNRGSIAAHPNDQGCLPQVGLREASGRRQRSTPTEMLRPVSWAMVGILAISLTNAGSLAIPSCTLPYTSQLA